MSLEELQNTLNKHLRETMEIFTNKYQSKNFQFLQDFEQTCNDFSLLPSFLTYNIHDTTEDYTPHGAKPSEIIPGILRADKFIATCQLAISVAQYNALLKTFCELLGEKAGQTLFDRLFSHRLRIRDVDIHAGTAFFGEAVNCLKPQEKLHPLSYFVESSPCSLIRNTKGNKASFIEEGDFNFFFNHSSYTKVHPASTARRIATLCVGRTSQSTIHMALGVEKKELSENDIIQYLVEEYNLPPSQIEKRRLLNNTDISLKKTITASEIPGLDLRYTRRFNLKLIQWLLANPEQGIHDFNHYMDQEQNEISNLQEGRVKKLQKVGHFSLQEKIEYLDKETKELRNLGVNQTKNKQYAAAIKTFLNSLITGFDLYITYLSRTTKKEKEMTDLLVHFACLHFNISRNYMALGMCFQELKHLKLSRDILIIAKTTYAEHTSQELLQRLHKHEEALANKVEELDNKYNVASMNPSAKYKQ